MYLNVEDVVDELTTTLSTDFAKGVYKGRQQIEKPLNFDQVYFELYHRRISLKQALALTGLKRSTFYNLSKTINLDNKENQESLKE